MLRNKLYYRVKPVLPAHFRLMIRRWLALRKRERVMDIWPIVPGSERQPEGWSGWPEGKQFAVVLTHDVEGSAGLAKCRQLMEIEMRLGFRSSFNFIPEGEYRVQRELCNELIRNGFEVGVHDLQHDGRLYTNRGEFAQKAKRINHYLKDWDAVGFRSGSMFHNLEWIHDLDIRYDASTFDTDPFEPQPDGVDTIFPFWVPRPQWVDANQRSSLPGHNGDSALRTPHSNGGYVELPYTLPQDSTLFLLFGERHPEIWLRKLDWIAKHGGMVLLDTHPDYMAMNGSPRVWEYPVAFYERLLEYIRTSYAGAYWQALPRQVADFVKASSAGTRRAGKTAATFRGGLSRSKRKPKIWIDLDNTPHVPFFEPILEELKVRGFPLLVTARDAFQVCELADKKGLQYVRIGRHYGKNRLLKAGGLAYRALQLAPLIVKERPTLGLSHGARSQLLLGNWLGIPTVLIEDYEFSQFPPMMRPTWVMAPEVIPDDALCGKNGRIRKYPGIKEDVYAWKLKPDPAALRKLGLGESDLVVTVRPPATEAHYHNPESEGLFVAFMNRACETPQVRVVLLPRNSKQAESIKQQWPAWFDNNKTVIPPTALDGLNLIWHSDLVVSGGGTMNREAAALGVPVYTIFRSTLGAVDRNLSAEGRLVLIESVEAVHRSIKIVRRVRKSVSEITSRMTLEAVVDAIEEIAETHSGS